jgi:hypothetical protein
VKLSTRKSQERKRSSTRREQLVDEITLTENSIAQEHGGKNNVHLNEAENQKV